MDIQTKISNNSVFNEKPKAINIIKKRIAVNASTMGYCKLTFSPQLLHFPLKVNKYEKTGILSNHFIGSLHLGHFEAGNTIDSLDKALSATTFKNLPIHAPITSTKKYIIKCSSINPANSNLYFSQIVFQVNCLMLF